MMDPKSFQLCMKVGKEKMYSFIEANRGVANYTHQT
jgi:hypothetical protein